LKANPSEEVSCARRLITGRSVPIFHTGGFILSCGITGLIRVLITRRLREPRLLLSATALLPEKDGGGREAGALPLNIIPFTHPHIIIFRGTAKASESGSGFSRGRLSDMWVHPALPPGPIWISVLENSAKR